MSSTDKAFVAGFLSASAIWFMVAVYFAYYSVLG